MMSSSVSLAASLILSTAVLTWAQGPSCPGDQSCVGVRSCDSVVAQLQRAKEETDEQVKAGIISGLRDQVCGARSARTVCCPRAGSRDTGEAGDGTGETEVKKIGEFVNIFHDIAGTVFALDDKTIVIKDFNYDGEGPDAFFLAGTSGRPNKRGEVILPYPGSDKTFSYSSRDIPVLGRFQRDKDILLKLPEGWTVNQLKWISVWCRDYTVDFGHATLSA